jgi:hypothetical protein
LADKVELFFPARLRGQAIGILAEAQKELEKAETRANQLIATNKKS